MRRPHQFSDIRQRRHSEAFLQLMNFPPGVSANRNRPCAKRRQSPSDNRRKSVCVRLFFIGGCNLPYDSAMCVPIGRGRIGKQAEKYRAPGRVIIGCGIILQILTAPNIAIFGIGHSYHKKNRTFRCRAPSHGEARQSTGGVSSQSKVCINK